MLGETVLTQDLLGMLPEQRSRSLNRGRPSVDPQQTSSHPDFAESSVLHVFDDA